MRETENSYQLEPLLRRVERRRSSHYAPIVQRPRMRPFHGRDPGSNPGRGIYYSRLNVHFV